MRPVLILIETILKTVRERRYGTREPTYQEPFYRRQRQYGRGKFISIRAHHVNHAADQARIVLVQIVCFVSSIY